MKISNRIPLFEKGKILDKEMLDELKNISINHIGSLYSYLGDGVIYGVSTNILSDNKVVINEGVIKYNNELYKINNKKTIIIPEEDGEYICILKKHEQINKDKFIELIFSLELIKNGEIEFEDFEIFRIIRREGANIKEPILFNNLNKEYNTLNTINLKVSTPSGENLCLSLLKLYARNMIKYKKIELDDKIVCLHILNSNCEREFLLNYLELDDLSNNMDIYIALEKKFINIENIDNKKLKNTIKINKMLVD